MDVFGLWTKTGTLGKTEKEQTNTVKCGSCGSGSRVALWFDPRLLQSACQGVLGQMIEPQIVPDVSPGM